jgi:hypothetical protein
MGRSIGEWLRCDSNDILFYTKAEGIAAYAPQTQLD